MQLIRAFITGRSWFYPVVIGLALVGSSVVAAETGGAPLLSETSSSSPTATITPSSKTTPAGAVTTTDTPTVGASGISQTADAVTGPAGGGGGKNIVRVVNQVDNRLKARGSTQLNQIPGPNVEPVNFAYAYGSCTDCQTLAIALQINLTSKTASRVAPQNAAIAVNYQCTRCVTVALAYQYNIPVDNPTQLRQDVSDLARGMDRELQILQSDHEITLSQAVSQIDAVISQYAELTQYLITKSDQTTDTTSPNATPPATDTSTATTTPTSTGTPTATDTATLTTPQPTDTATPSPTPSLTLTATF